MNDDMHDPQEPVPAEPELASEAAVAWKAVLAELDVLGDALGRWTKAAVNDPENKRRFDEFSARLDGLVDNVGATAKNAVDTEVGQSFKDAADKTGDALRTAGEKISEEVGPRLAGAFKSMSDKLRGAAEKIEERQADEAAAPDESETPNDPGPGA